MYKTDYVLPLANNNISGRKRRALFRRNLDKFTPANAAPRGLHIAARVKTNFRHKFVRRSIVISFTNLVKIYESADSVPQRIL